MTNKGSRMILVALLAVMVGAAGCSNDENDPLAPGADPKEQALALGGDAALADGDDIVDIAAAAGDFTTLVAAVQAAGLEDALRGENPLTVFAPTDDAFAKLPDGFVADLLEPRNEQKLQELLLYHVVAGAVMSDDLRLWQFTETLQGQYLWIRKWWGVVKVNQARVAIADIEASNGVIHAVDEVLVPRGFELVPEAPTADIVDTAIAAGGFETLVAAAGAAGLVDALRGDDLTVFAPTDEAFGKLPPELVSALLLPENRAKLQELLLYHVVSGRVQSGDLDTYQRVPTLQGGNVKIVKWFGNVWVNWSRVTTPDVLATNGVIHVINRVLVPRGFSLETAAGTFTGEELEARMNATSRDEMPPTEFPTQYLTPVD